MTIKLVGKEYKIPRKAEAEVVQTSSLVEVKVDVGVDVEVEIEVDVGVDVEVEIEVDVGVEVGFL